MLGAVFAAKYKSQLIIAGVVIAIVVIIYLAGRKSGKNKADGDLKEELAHIKAPLPLPTGGNGIGPNFSASNLAGKLNRAMKGMGTDEDAIYDVFLQEIRTDDELIAVNNEYNRDYGTKRFPTLRSALQYELTSGEFDRIAHVVSKIPTQ